MILEHAISPLSIAFHTHKEAPAEQSSQVLRLLLEAGVDSTVTDNKGQAIGDVYDLLPELAELKGRGN